MDMLFKSDIGPVYEDVSMLSLCLLEDILSVVLRMKKGDELLVSVCGVCVCGVCVCVCCPGASWKKYYLSCRG